MEIESELDIEIFQTLNLIKRTEEMINLHQNREDFSELAVAQYRRMKEDLSKQLAQLLVKYHLNVQILPLAA
jgi:ABC-type sugar transport system ATPase subunit